MCTGITAAPSSVPIPVPSAAPVEPPTPVPYPAPTPVPTGPRVSVDVPAVVVSSSLQMTGVTAADFQTPAQQASFASAIESSLTIDATVTNIVATNIARRRLTIRTLLQSGVDVSYDLVVVIAEGWVLPICTPPPHILRPASRARTADNSLFPIHHPLWNNPQVRRQTPFSQKPLRTSRPL